MKLSSHVLDTTAGTPAANVAIELYAVDRPERGAARYERTWLGKSATDGDGRWIYPLLDGLALGTYELTFDVAPYFRERNVATLYDVIAIRFVIDDAERNYHIPLLLAPYGYSTYRGS